MITSLRVPSDKTALNYLREAAYKGDEKRQCVILPTARALRELSYEPFKLTDFYTIKDFTTYTAVSKKPDIPVELRSFYLKQAALQLTNKDKATLFTKHDSVFLDSYVSFQNIASSLLAFYRELNAEMIDEKYLFKNNLLLYTDYEEQVKTLFKLWKLYLTSIDKLGYSDAWDSYKEAIFDQRFIDRYESYIFLIGGYLTKYELTQLKKLSEIKDVTLIFNFTGKKDNQHKQYEKVLGIKIDDDIPADISRDKCKIYEMDSVLAQVEMITFTAGYYNKQHGIPYKRMAVILPSDEIKSYFLRLDRYELFDVTANEDISRAEFFTAIESALEIVIAVAKTGKAQLSLLINFYYNLIIQKSLKTKEIVHELDKKIGDGKLSLTASELISLPFFDKISNLFEAGDKRYRLTAIIKKIKQLYLSFSEIDNEEIQAYDAFNLALERLMLIYKDIDEEFDISDAVAIIMNSLSQIKMQTAKGSITVSGVLESRMLDYDLIFIPQLSEGVFPKKNRKELFLNTEMRKELELPTFIDRENLLKNYLYQIISKSKIAVLSYSTGSGTHTHSRVIDELTVNHGIVVEERHTDKVSLFRSREFYKKTATNELIIKTDEMMKKINSIEFSATAINRYINCGIQYYYENILKPNTENEATEKVNSLLLGNAFHHTLKAIKDDTKVELGSDEYMKSFENYFTAYLKNYDVYNDSVVDRFVAQECLNILPDFIAKEKERSELGYKTILTETTIHAEFEGVKLRGGIDRVDQAGNDYEIIDYKFKDPKVLEKLVGKIDDADMKNYPDLQLPFYALLLELDKKIKVSGLYQISLRSYIEYFKVFDMKFFEKYKSFLRQTLHEIKDINAPFKHAERTDICEYCSYSAICGRW